MKHRRTIAAPVSPSRYSQACSFGPARFTDDRPGSLLTEGTLAAWAAHVLGEAGSIEQDPRLDGNQRLGTGSPCIDRGDVIGAVAFDVDRGARSGSYEIGADERK